MTTVPPLIERIRSDRNAARKSGDARRTALLTTLVAEAAMVGKNAGNRESTDDEVIAVVKRFVTNIDETHKIIEATARPDQIVLARLAAEREILSDYLPALVGAAELRAFVEDQVKGGATALGPIMGAVKKRFGAAADMKLASTIAKEILG